MSFEDCRLQFTQAAEVFLVRIHNGEILRATPVAMHPAYCIVATQGAEILCKQGEKLFVIVPMSPQEYSVWLTCMDTIDFCARFTLRYQSKRFTLRYQDPSEDAST